MTVDPKLVMRKVATSVSVVLVKDQTSVIGCTISSLIAIDIRPDSFRTLFVLSKNSLTGKAIINHKRFSINVLSESMLELASWYSKEGRTGHALNLLPNHVLMRSDTPVLQNPFAILECCFLELIPFEESNLIISQVNKCEASESGFPLIYFDRNFRRLKP